MSGEVKVRTFFARTIAKSISRSFKV